MAEWLSQGTTVNNALTAPPSLYFGRKSSKGAKKVLELLQDMPGRSPGNDDLQSGVKSRYVKI
jgi:hypothetical protein